MADILYQVDFQLLINSFDVTEAIKPYLLSIVLEDNFDTNFTTSKLELSIHSSYRRSSSWAYKDTIVLKLWWRVLPDAKYTSSVFYVDYVEVRKEAGGNQIFLISALEADLNLGFTFGGSDVSYVNISIRDAFRDFINRFNLNFTTTIPETTYLGTVPKDETVTTSTIFLAKYDNYPEFVKSVTNDFSYLSNLSGLNLSLISINSSFGANDRFFVWDLEEVFSFNYKQTFNNIPKKFQCNFVDRDDNNKVKEIVLTPSMEAELNNKEIRINDNEAYYNIETASEILYGAMNKAFLDGFEVNISLSGLPTFKAGEVFLLNASYGVHEGYYRCTKIVHRVDSGGWITEITGFPIKKLAATVAKFEIGGYQGRFDNPTGDNGQFWELDDDYGVRNYNLSANKYDEFATHLNPEYNYNFGSIVLNYGNSKYDIDPAVIFCMMLVMSDNFNDGEMMARFNPMGLLDIGGLNSATFPDFDTGIKAAVQHFYAYAHEETTQHPDLSAPELVDPRFNFVTRGIAPYLFQLNGRWTGRLDFSEMVISKIIQFYKHAYPDWAVAFNSLSSN